MLLHVPIGPFPDQTYGVGYQTPGCSVMTVVVIGMTAERAADESQRLNDEQVQRTLAVQRNFELRNRTLGLTPAVDFLPDWMPHKPSLFKAELDRQSVGQGGEADAKQGYAHAAREK